jgi:hypothetical protein
VRLTALDQPLTRKYAKATNPTEPSAMAS